MSVGTTSVGARGAGYPRSAGRPAGPPEALVEASRTPTIAPVVALDVDAPIVDAVIAGRMIQPPASSVPSGRQPSSCQRKVC